MAKWGEGDPRWIVEERQDATNVNNWHWSEKNATPWSKERLKQLLVGIKLEKGPMSVEVVEMKKLEGEATANNRKGKLIFFYEWELQLRFEGHVAGSDVEYKGYFEIPNLSDENSADEIDVNLVLESTGAHEAGLRHLVKTEGEAKIRAQLAIYIRELKEEFSRGLIVPTEKKPKEQIVCTTNKTSTSSASSSNANVDKRQFQNQIVTGGGADNRGDGSAADGESSKPTGPMKTISLMESFKVKADQLYEVLTDAAMVRRWTNSDPSLDLREGGHFMLFGGMVSGIFEKLVERELLVMKWRLKSYPSGHWARVTMTLRDTGEGTDFSIEAVDVPATMADDTERGLRNNYMESIARTFGFRARIM